MAIPLVPVIRSVSRPEARVSPAVPSPNHGAPHGIQNVPKSAGDGGDSPESAGQDRWDDQLDKTGGMIQLDKTGGPHS